MVGIVIVTHCKLGEELINTAEFILGGIENIVSVSIDPQATPEAIRGEIERGVKKVNQGQGVIILTDMFGGTPSNISLSFLNLDKIEVISGVNLSMIIKLIQSRNKMAFSDLAETVGDYGRKSIKVASAVLTRRLDE